MTLREIEKRLMVSGIDGAMHEALLIAEHFTNKSAALLLAEPDADLGQAVPEDVLRQRCGRYPLQYLLGEWEFCGMPFKLTPDCLIPRPDTEILVEAAVKHLPKGGRILDLCTGTGCVLAAALKLSGNTHGTAVELYPAVAEIARENFARFGLDVRLTVGDATADLFGGAEKFDVITANPPYVTADEMHGLEAELAFEPRTALTDGGDGLSIIREIIRVYGAHLSEGGVMLIEHGASQAAEVAVIARENGLTHSTLRDYGGHDRVAVMALA